MARLVTRTGGFSVAGRRGKVWPIEGALESRRAPSEPVLENSPRYGAGTPLKASHGVLFWRVLNAFLASPADSGEAKLAPSSYTRPARSEAPGWPEKLHVAYAVTTEPPSEWPPRTTRPPSL